MKKLFAIVAAVIVSTAAFSQDNKKTETVAPAPAVSAAGAPVMKHDCYTMKDNALMHCMGTKMEPQKTDVTLRDGSILNAKGQVKKADGTIQTLANGQCITMSGVIGSYEKMHTEMKTDKKADDKMMEAKPVDVK